MRPKTRQHCFRYVDLLHCEALWVSFLLRVIQVVQVVPEAQEVLVDLAAPITPYFQQTLSYPQVLDLLLVVPAAPAVHPVQNHQADQDFLQHPQVLYSDYLLLVLLVVRFVQYHLFYREGRLARADPAVPLVLVDSRLRQGFLAGRAIP